MTADPSEPGDHRHGREIEVGSPVSPGRDQRIDGVGGLAPRVRPRAVHPVGALPADLIPADLLPADLLPADLIPADLLPADLIPADLIPVDVLASG